MIAIAREGVSPIVRIPANEAWMVKRKYRIVISSRYTFEASPFLHILYIQS